MKEIMPNYPELYILGKPIKTKFGVLNPIYMSEYHTLTEYIGFLLNTSHTLTRIVLKGINDVNARKEMNKIIKEFGFLPFLKWFGEGEYLDRENSTINPLHILMKKYEELINWKFDNNVWSSLEKTEEFDECLKLIRDYNGIYYREPKKNALFEAYTQAEERIKNKGATSISFEAKYTSVWLSTGTNPETMTLYQFNRVFDRISKYKQYDTTTLFATVASDVDIVGWFEDVQYKHVDKKIKVHKDQISSREELANIK